MLIFEKPQRQPNFEDCFSGENSFPEKSPKELAKIALASSPLWFQIMFSLRQKLAGLFGLLTETPEGKDPGVGFLLSLPIIQDDETAYEAGLADKHLDFTIRISKEDDQINLRTQVWFNNFWGKIYLKIVMPFHNLIVSHWVKSLGVAR